MFSLFHNNVVIKETKGDKMLGEKKKQLGITDLQSERSEAKLSQHFLFQVDDIIDWEPMTSRIKSLYRDNVGRPSYPLDIMIKILLLQKWYNMSDPETEFAIMDRWVFRRFLELSSMGEVPDETTICRFRNKLVENDLIESIFDEINRQLEKQDYIVEDGSAAIDATLIKAHHRQPRKGEPGKDPDAAYTSRNNKPFYGYKGHIINDLFSGAIIRAAFTPANVHDSSVFDELIPPRSKAVFGDKAYGSKKRKQEMRANGVFYGILDKAHRNRPLSKSQKKRNKKKSKVRYAVERPFAHMKGWFKRRQTRYRGLAKNRADFITFCGAYNIRIIIGNINRQQGSKVYSY